VRPGTDTPSAHRRGINDADLADRFDSYRADLQSQPLAAHTRRTYAGRVGGYLAWLAECDPQPPAPSGRPVHRHPRAGLHHPRLPQPPHHRPPR